MPCADWPILWPCDKEPEAPPRVLTEARKAAQSICWSLSGGRLGTCPTVERFEPVAGGACGGPWKSERTGRWYNGQVAASMCCAIHLGHLPVQRIDRVTVMGEVMNPSEYRLARGGVLARIGGCWPAGNTCDVPPVMVEYTWGVQLVVDPDADTPVWTNAGSVAAMAMGELAAELVEGMCGRPCKLPSRIANITRQGVSVEYISPEEWLRLGLEGLPLTDQLIRRTNPHGRRNGGRRRIMSPDMARPV